jgi:hypothetical protein
MAQKFLLTETFARVQGRIEKRQAMAVMVGINGRPTPVYEDFAVTEADRGAIDRLVKDVSKVFDGKSFQKREVVLAALAEFAAKYMQTESVKNTSKSKAVR